MTEPAPQDPGPPGELVPDGRSGPAVRDRPLHLRTRLSIFAAGLVAFLLFRVLAAAPSVVEFVYGTGLGPVVAWGLSRFSGFFPFALIELLFVSYVVWLIGVAGLAVREAAAGRRRWRNVLGAGTTRIARDAGLLVVFFYVAWGFNYARAPLRERLGWPDWIPPDTVELQTLASELVEAANLAYLTIHRVEDAGVPTARPADLTLLENALEEGWEVVAELLSLPAPTSRRYGPVKRLALTPLVVRFGVAGFYSPFTGEANVLGDLPAASLPVSMAHEKAHQRGVGPESEASFLGFLVASAAPHPVARYAAYLYAQNRVLGPLMIVNPERGREIAGRRLAGVRRDLGDVRRYWRRADNVASEVQAAVNHRFLSANRVPGGLASYGRSLRLIVAFARVNDGRAIVSADSN